MSTVTVNICEAHEDLSQLISLAQEGTEVILANGTMPLARIVPIASAAQERIPDLNPDSIWVSDDFDAPLPDEFWEGK